MENETVFSGNPQELTPPAKPQKRKYKRTRLRSQDKLPIQITFYIYIGVMVIFSMIPLYITLLNSLKTNSQVATSIFSFPTFTEIFGNIGTNFAAAWSIIIRYMLNSVLVSFVAAFLNVFVASVLAYLFARKHFVAKEFIFTLYIMILLIPSILGMSTLYPMMAETFGMKNNYLAVWLPVLAGGQAGALFLFRTFFGSHPAAVYESAMLDGANDVQIYLYFTVPFALPIILLNFVSTFSGQYNDYLWTSLILEGDMLTLTPVLFARSAEFNSTQQAVGYAAYLIASIPLIFVTALSLEKFQSGDFAAGLKL